MNYSITPSKCRYAADDMQIRATLLNAATTTCDKACYLRDQKLGKIQGIMLDITEVKIRYGPNMANATRNSTVKSYR